MILFKPEHVDKILSGEKTQTRRLVTYADQRPRWKAAAIHQCFTQLPFTRRSGDPPKPFARVKIMSVRQEELGAISLADSRREGYGNEQDYFIAFHRINGLVGKDALDCHVWVIDFELVRTEVAV